MQNEQAYYNNPNAGASFNFRQGKWSVILISEWEAGQTDKDIRCPTVILLSEMSLFGFNDDPNKILVEDSMLIMKSIKTQSWIFLQHEIQ